MSDTKAILSKINQFLTDCKNFSINHEFSLKNELWRQISHLLIIIFPLAYLFVLQETLLYFLIPICTTIILIDYFRHKYGFLANIVNKLFATILREHEKKQLSGASYFSIGALVIFPIAPENIAINAFLILAISDSLATIIGKKIKSEPFFEKSLSGSLAFFISAILITISLALFLDESILYYLFALPAIIAATIIEARPKLLNLDDNLTIPLSFSLVLIGFNMIWVYN
jgi:dolichol kinase